MTRRKDNTLHFIHIVADISGLGGIFLGYNIAVISCVILFIKADFRLSAISEGIIMSAASLGALAGAETGGFSLNGFDRSETLFFGTPSPPR